MTNQAWECPRCKRINAPFNHSCFCIPADQSDISGLKKVLRDIKAQQQFNPKWVAHCHNCGEMLNGLTKHICKVWL
jgi:hypothetical protein